MLTDALQVGQSLVAAARKSFAAWLLTGTRGLSGFGVCVCIRVHSISLICIEFAVKKGSVFALKFIVPSIWPSRSSAALS
jgi:hypothetical protein